MHPRLRQRIEGGFETFAGIIYRHAWITLLLVLMTVAGLAAQIPKLTLDTSTEGFLHEHDPTLLTYNDFRAQFGRDEMVLVAIEAPDVFERGFLEKLRTMHRRLEDEVPHLEEITSLVDARNTRGAEGELIVEDLLQEWPEDAAGLAAIRSRALANPLYRNLLINDDATITTVVIETNAYSGGDSVEDALAGFDEPAFSEPAAQSEREFLSDAENSELVRQVQAIAADFNGDDFRIYVGGSPVVTDVLKTSMQDNMRRFMVLALLTITVVLAFLFRRASGVLLPLLVVVLTLVSTLGLMAVAKVPIKLPTQILPSFLLAVGVGASVHVLAVFYRRLQQIQDDHADAEPPETAKRDAVVHALGHSGLAIVMTSLTTAAGLASFAGAEVAPIGDLGQAAAIGVLISLLFTIVLLPALLSIFRIRPIRRAASRQQQLRMDRLLVGIADYAVERRKRVLLVSSAVLLFGLAGALQVKFSHKPFEWLPVSAPSRQATDFLDSRMGGANVMEVVVDTGRENGLYEPATLRALDTLERELSALERPELFVGKTMALPDVLKEINQALNENRSDHYIIPDDRNLIAQEFLLFSNSGSDDLEDFTDTTFQKARFTLKTPWVDAVHYPGFITELEQQFDHALDDTAQVTVTGMAALLGRTVDASIHSMAKSYVWAAVIITGMMILLIGDLRVGLVSMLPNLTPIILTLGLMGWLGLPLDLFTMLIGSIAIGLAVDDTIHFMHNYRRYHHDTGDVREAVRRTLLTTGRAMLVTTVVLSIGFFIFSFSTLSNLVNFGLLTGFTIIAALLADFFLAPALMAQLHASHLIPDEGDY